MIKIVIADDNQILLQQLVDGLKKSSKIEIVGIANNGEEELEYINKFQPDIVITDIEMPKLTGIDVINRVKELENRPIFLVITGAVNGNIMNELYSLPIQKIYRKPFDISLLVRDIEDLSISDSKMSLNTTKETKKIPNTRKTFSQSIMEFLKKGKK